jgi:hypothetical protein
LIEKYNFPSSTHVSDEELYIFDELIHLDSISGKSTNLSVTDCRNLAPEDEALIGLLSSSSYHSELGECSSVGFDPSSMLLDDGYQTCSFSFCTSGTATPALLPSTPGPLSFLGSPTRTITSFGCEIENPENFNKQPQQTTDSPVVLKAATALEPHQTVPLSRPHQLSCPHCRSKYGSKYSFQ